MFRKSRISYSVKYTVLLCKETVLLCKICLTHLGFPLTIKELKYLPLKTSPTYSKYPYYLILRHIVYLFYNRVSYSVWKIL